MIFQPNMIVIIKNGRLAGKKAVVLKELNENTLIVAGVNRIPKESKDHMAPWEKRKNEKFLTFVKKIGIKHVLATRYKADIGLDRMSNVEEVESVEKKQNLNKNAGEILKKAFEENKAKWLFTALKF